MKIRIFSLFLFLLLSVILLFVLFQQNTHKIKSINENNDDKINKNIVIVLSRGYRKNTLFSFFITLKKQSPNSYLLIFSDNDTISYSQKILNNGKVIGIELLKNYPYYPSNHSLYPISEEFLNKNIPSIINSKYNFFYHTIRFFLVNVWLKKYSELFKFILICDIKDIVFQNDPFTYYNESGLYLQQEINIRNGKSGIIADELNYAWIKPYNPSKDILVNPIINSGQILSSSKEMKYFISEFCLFMSETHLNTAEQGSLNYFIYSKKYNRKLIIKEHGYGYALLLHYSIPRTNDEYTPNNNYFYNLDGSIPPIIHAYYLGFIYGSRNRKEKYKEFIEYHNKI